MRSTVLILLLALALAGPARAQAPTDLEPLLALPPSPGVDVLLLPFAGDPRVTARWREALSAPDPERRAVAARMLSLAGVRAAVADLMAAAEDERDGVARREMVRALVVLGSAETDKAVLAMLAEVDARAAIGAVVATVRPASVVTHLLDGGVLAAGSDVTAGLYARIAKVSPAEASRLEEGLARQPRPKALQGVLHMAHSSGRRVPTALLMAGVRENAATAGEVLAYVPAIYGTPTAAADDATLVTAYAAARAAGPAVDDPTHAFVLALLDRWLQQDAAPLAALIATVPADGFDALLLPTSSLAVLTLEERGALVRHLGRTGQAREAIMTAATSGPSAPSDFEDQLPHVMTLHAVTAGVMAELQRLTGCTGKKSLEDRAATITYKADGRPQRASVDGVASLAPECQRFGQLLISTSYGAPALSATPPMRTVLRMTKEWIDCATAQEAFERLQRERPRPVSRPRAPVERPRKVRDQLPTYPAAAQHAGISGTVLVRAVIAPTGCVASASVMRSVPALDLAALQAVTYWRYAPLEIDGERVSYFMDVQVAFTLPK